MDSKQIDHAMKRRLPVKYNGMRYDRIAEYVSWYDNERKHHLSAVLLLGRNSYRVPADKVDLWED